MKKKSLWKVLTDKIATVLKDKKTRRNLIAAFAVITIASIIWIAYGHKLIAVLVLFVFGAISMIHKRKVKGLPIGIEFVTMTTVIMSITHSAVAGALFGFLTSVTAQIIAQDFDGDMVLYFASMTIVGAVAGSTPLPHIITLSLMCLLTSISSQFFDIIGAPEQKVASIIYIATNQILNLGLWNPIGMALLRFAV